MMQISVKNLMGRYGMYAVQTHLMIEDLKNLIMDREGLPPYLQRLICEGRQLEGGRSLAEYGVERDTTLYLVLSLRGGMQGAHIPLPSFAPQNISTSEDESMSESHSPPVNALVVRPESVLALRENSGSSFEMNLSQIGRLRLISQGLPQMQVDWVVTGQAPEDPQVQLTPEAFQTYEQEMVGALVERGEPGEVCVFDPESEDPVFRQLAHHEIAIGQLWNYSEWLRLASEKGFGDMVRAFREHREILCRVGQAYENLKAHLP